MTAEPISEEVLKDLLHFSECYTNDKEKCPENNPKCEQLRIQYDHVLKYLNDNEHYSTCEICQNLNRLIQYHHKDNCCLQKCVFRTVSRFYIFAKHYLLCDKKAYKKCKFCRDNHTLYKIMETCLEKPEEAFLGIYGKAHAAVEHAKCCNRSDCWVCHVPYLEKQGLINEFEPKKTKSVKYRKPKSNSNSSYMKLQNEMIPSYYPKVAHNETRYSNSYYSNTKMTPRMHSTRPSKLYDRPQEFIPSQPLPYHDIPEDRYSMNAYTQTPLNDYSRSYIPERDPYRPPNYSNSYISQYKSPSYVDYYPQPFTSESIEEPFSSDYQDPFLYRNTLMLKKQAHRTYAPSDPYVPPSHYTSVPTNEYYEYGYQEPNLHPSERYTKDSSYDPLYDSFYSMRVPSMEHPFNDTGKELLTVTNSSVIREDPFHRRFI